MDRTSVIVVSTCVALLGLNWYCTAQKEAETQAETANPAISAPADMNTATTESQTPTAEQGTQQGQPAQATEQQPVQAQPVVSLETIGTLTSKDSSGNEVAKYVIQNLGGGIQHVEMLGQMVDSTKPELGNVCINKTIPDGPDGKNQHGIGTLMFNLNSGEVAPTLDNSVYQVIEQTDSSITIQSTNVKVAEGAPAFTVTKTYSLMPIEHDGEAIDGNAYVVKVDIKVKNSSNAPLSLSNWGVYGGSMCQVNNADRNVTSFIAMESGDFDEEDSGIFTPFFGKDHTRIYNTDYKNLEWAGLMSQYFATIIQPAQNSGTRSVDAVYIAPAKFALQDMDEKAEGFVLGFGMDAISNLSVGQESTYSYEVFTGPKRAMMLSDLEYKFHNISDIMDYGWVSLISRAMNWMITTFAGWVGNYGVAIIIMTFVIRLLIWPLYRKSYMSMKRMSLLQPMMQEIKTRCGDDRQKAGMEMMALYRKYNISPLGGCLPMLLQIPIFFAFFYVLQTAAELRGAHFLFWITDLSQPDTIFTVLGLPINVLPFIMAASMIAMMKMSPSAGDPMQQKIMKWMPVIFFIFCYTYPSALALYWTTTNVISIIQTLIIRRLPQPTLEQAAAAGAAANAKKKGKEGFFARIQRMAEEQQKQLNQQKNQGNMRNVTKKK